MKKLFLLIFLFLTSPAWGTTYYIAASGGSDSNPGTSAQPWNTFSKAISTMACADTLIVKAGTYAQTITFFDKDCTAGNPITIQGELDDAGTRLSIIDTSTTVTGWVTAPEKGTGVYKKSGIGYRPGAMSVIVSSAPYSIPRLCTALDSLPQGCSNSNLNELATAADYAWPSTYQGGTNPLYWDGIEAMFGSDATYTYIRFRNGDNPSGYTIKASPPDEIIGIYGSTYITIKNLKIRASTTGVTISTAVSDANPSSYITLNNNEIYNGALKISASGNNLTISDNLLYQQSYGEQITGDYFGPWICTSGQCTADTAINEHLYQFFKYKCDNGSNGRPSGGIFAGGTGITISGNTIYKVEDAIGFTGSSNSANVYGNTMHDHDSACIFFQGGTANGASVHDNLCYNASDAFRYGSTNLGGGPMYIYSNRWFQPANLGRQIYWHFDLGSNGASTHPTVYLYHNSWSGGSLFESISDWYSTWSGNSMDGVYFVNNISSTPEFDGNTTNAPLGECAYNWLSGTSINSNCDGTNITSGSMVSGWNTFNDFTAPVAAVDAGIDISTTWLTHAALPGFTTGYFSGAGPDMGWAETEYGGDVAPTLPGDTTIGAVVTGTSVALSWTAATDDIGVTGYKIERCTGAGCSSYAQIDTTTAVSYTNSQLACGTTYKWRVRAYDASGNNSSYYTAVEASAAACPVASAKIYRIIKNRASITPVAGTCANLANSAKITIANATVTATLRFAWDATSFYFCISVPDTKVNAYSTTADSDVWLGDAVEIFFDPANAAGEAMVTGQKQLLVNTATTKEDYNGQDDTWDPTYTVVASYTGSLNYDSDTDALYVIEGSATWANLGITAPAEGDSWGFDAAFDDRNGTSSVYTAWANTDGTGFRTPAGWGTMIFEGLKDSVVVGSGSAITVGSGGTFAVGN